MITAYHRRKFRSKNRAISNNKNNRPRAIVFRSNKNIFIQLLGDNGRVLQSFSTKNLLESIKYSGIEGAQFVGKEFAKRCIEKGITTIVFDKGAYTYGGRVKALAESCRKNGLIF